MSFFDTTWYLNYGNGSSTGYYAVTKWSASASVAAGVFRRQNTTPTVANERIFASLNAGTTNSTEPTWTLTRGAKTTDNTVTWIEVTGASAINGDFTNATVWNTVKNQAVTQGQIIYDSASGSIQIVSTAGTAGNGSTPSFSATAGVTTTDNTITWTSLGPSSAFTGWQYPHARLQNVTATGWVTTTLPTNIYTAAAHAETQAAANNTIPNSGGAMSAPLAILSVSTSAAPPTSLSAGASITTTGANALNFGNSNNNGLSVYAYVYGFTFNCGTGSSQANMLIGATEFGNAAMKITMDTCAFNLKTTSSSSTLSFGPPAWSDIQLYNCTMSFGATGQGISTCDNLKMIGGTIAASGTVPSTLFQGASPNTELVFRDVDLSAITGNLVNASAFVSGSIYFENCKIGSGVGMFTGSAGTFGGVYLRLHNADSAATNYRYFYEDLLLGSVQSETTVVRTGGATNGTTPESWNFQSSANTSFFQPFISEEIAQWNDNSGTSKTATIYLTTNTTLNNNDIWLEIEYPSSASFPLGSVANNKMTILGTPAALSSDTSTWGGSITNKYKLQVTFTPQMKGPVKARIYLAKPSVTVYVDPLLNIA